MRVLYGALVSGGCVLVAAWNAASQDKEMPRHEPVTFMKLTPSHPGATKPGRRSATCWRVS